MANLLRLVACVYLLVSLNSYGAHLQYNKNFVVIDGVAWLKMSLTESLAINNTYTENGWELTEFDNHGELISGHNPYIFSDFTNTYGSDAFMQLSEFMHPEGNSFNSLFEVRGWHRQYGYIDYLMFDIAGNVNSTIGDYVSSPSGMVDLDGNHFGGGYFLSKTVPIPAAVWLFGSALAGLGVARCKKKENNYKR